MKKKINISLIQMDIQLGNKQSNLTRIKSSIIKSIENAPKGIPHIICLPELCSTGFDLQNYKKHAENIPGGITTDLLSNLAQKYEVFILGSYIEEFKGLYYNTAVTINNKGVVISKYRKVHLFPLHPMQESEYFTSGANTDFHPIIDFNGFKIGILICFDIRFPEISRRLVLEGADCVIYLAEFPNPRDDVWTTLLRARAIENQIFVAGVNRVGKDPEISFFGKSMVIDPQGNTINSASDKEEIISAVLDLDLLISTKEFIPTLNHRKPEHY